MKLCDSLRAGGGGGGGDVGVVGIDVAGDEGAAFDGADGIVLAPVEREVFSRARDLGIRRTAHAGEAGPAGSVAQALDELHAERVGHGYHSVDDPDVYRRVLRERVHLVGWRNFGYPVNKVSTDFLNVSCMLQWNFNLLNIDLAKTRSNKIVFFSVLAKKSLSF